MLVLSVTDPRSQKAEFSGALRLTVPMEVGSTGLLSLYELMKHYRLLSGVRNEMTINANFAIIFGLEGYVIQLFCKLY